MKIITNINKYSLSLSSSHSGVDFDADGVTKKEEGVDQVTIKVRCQERLILLITKS